jgi:hypothetical protein
MFMAMTLRLTEEDEVILTRLAEQLGLSKQKALLEAMRMVERESRKKRRVNEALQFVLSHDKELMDRLADA